MFGSSIDYLLLRAIAHTKNLRSEEQLDADTTDDLGRRMAGARKKVQALKDEGVDVFEGARELSYLDVGCGKGEWVLELSRLGCADVTGIDIVPRNIRTAESDAEKLGLSGKVRFICDDINKWAPPSGYDVVFSIDALEHIDDPQAFLRRLFELLKPGGVAILSFGPLFYSPFGDHNGAFFRFQIPWRPLLFSEESLLRVRRTCYRPTDTARTFRERVGGLNLMRYSEYLAYLAGTRFTVKLLRINSTWKDKPLLHNLSLRMIESPRWRDYFASNVLTVLERP